MALYTPQPPSEAALPLGLSRPFSQAMTFGPCGMSWSGLLPLPTPGWKATAPATVPRATIGKGPGAALGACGDTGTDARRARARGRQGARGHLNLPAGRQG